MKKAMILKAALIILCFYQSLQQTSIAQPARFIWVDEITDQRQIYAYFRYDFTLKNKPREAIMMLFADSRYHLFINGIFVNFGPARTFPETPEYDTCDLSPYLKEGHNYIVDKVLWNGMETFQLLKNKPGFIAWGSVSRA